METFFIVLGITLGIFILIYIIAIFVAGQTILQSRIIRSTDVNGNQADHYYYLPKHSMTINATALVGLARDPSTQKIKASRLIQLTLEPQTSIVPDTSQLIALNYKGHWFFSDEVKVTTSSASLIENISSIAEDKIGQIVSQFTGAGKSLLDNIKLEGFAVDEEHRVGEPTETIEFKRQFTISDDDLQKGDFTVSWKIYVKGEYEKEIEPVNADFSMKTPNVFPPLTTQKVSFEGILTRPLINQTWKIQPKKDLTSSSFKCLVPNPSVLLVVPVRRSYFAKRQQMPKFSNGMLVENYINKPAEAEGLASIPINIAKAIVSIPAQLLQFKIIHLKQETEYEKETLALFNARQARHEAETGKSVKQLITELDEWKTKVSDLETKTKPQRPTPPPVTPKEKVPKLGKLPATDTDAMKLMSFAEGAEEVIALAGIEIPESKFWNDKFRGNWMDYKNNIDGELNCIPAAAAHIVTSWTSQTNAVATVLTQDDVDIAYQREVEKDPETGELKGCVLSQFLAGWKQKGIGNHMIQDYAMVRKKRKDKLQHCIFCFGACMVGFQMPSTARDQFSRWEVIADTSEVSSRPGSWGGHAVAAIGYDKDILLIISWGRVIEVTWEFYEKYNDESYTMLSSDWVNNEISSPSGFALTRMKEIIRNVKLS